MAWKLIRLVKLIETEGGWGHFNKKEDGQQEWPSQSATLAAGQSRQVKL